MIGRNLQVRYVLYLFYTSKTGCVHIVEQYEASMDLVTLASNMKKSMQNLFYSIVYNDLVKKRAEISNSAVFPLHLPARSLNDIRLCNQFAALSLRNSQKIIGLRLKALGVSVMDCQV